jgi:hypothetical protein
VPLSPLLFNVALDDVGDQFTLRARAFGEFGYSAG